MAPKEKIPVQVTGTERKGANWVVHFDAAPDVEISVADAQDRALAEGHDTVEWPLLGQMAKEKAKLA